MMDFSDALKHCKAGEKIARANWNGKNMFVVFQKAYPEGIPVNQNTAAALGIPVGTKKKFLPYLMLSTAQGDFVPYLISQTDALSSDWILV